MLNTFPLTNHEEYLPVVLIAIVNKLLPLSPLTVSDYMELNMIISMIIFWS